MEKFQDVQTLLHFVRIFILRVNQYVKELVLLFHSPSCSRPVAGDRLLRVFLRAGRDSTGAGNRFRE
jgi:hypothetical protein